MLSLYVSIGKNNSSSCHKQRGVFVGRSPGVGFGLPQPLPSERCFLCCYPAMNPIFLLRLLMGDLWMQTKSMDQEELYGGLDVEILFLSSRRVIFILCTCILAEQRFPGRFTTSQSLSTCRVCSWQEFSGILEFLDGIWKNLTGVNVNTLEMWPDRIRSLHATARWHMCLLRVRDHLML